MSKIESKKEDNPLAPSISSLNNSNNNSSASLLNQQQVSTSGSQQVNQNIKLNLDQIASSLLKQNFILTALELHTELAESGRELPRLRDFFS
jgi:hypothetical protein